MDNRFAQYASFMYPVSIDAKDVLQAAGLQYGFEHLFREFVRRNGREPRNIVIYRDGVSDSQFREVLEKELPAYRGAIESCQYTTEQCQIAMIVCQKRHSVRFFYEDTASGAGYLNPCPGLCVDASSSETDGNGRAREEVWKSNNGPSAIGCVINPSFVEFYLNSHLAGLGTSRPTKYILLRDEIGFTVQLHHCSIHDVFYSAHRF